MCVCCVGNDVTQTTEMTLMACVCYFMDMLVLLHSQGPIVMCKCLLQDVYMNNFTTQKVVYYKSGGDRDRMFQDVLNGEHSESQVRGAILNLYMMADGGECLYVAHLRIV